MVTSWSQTKSDRPFNLPQVIENNGEPSRARTCDPLIKSQLLYQLSYRPISGRELYVGELKSQANAFYAGVLIGVRRRCCALPAHSKLRQCGGAVFCRHEFVDSVNQAVDIRLRHILVSARSQCFRSMNVVSVAAVENARNSGGSFSEPRA